ncbi:ciliary microtubule associated protein 1A-like [Phoenicopterus ruber ruber]
MADWGPTADIDSITHTDADPSTITDAITNTMTDPDTGFGATSDMDGAWVGTWRPHRPRGPIMAHFTSPGPKYSIPGTTDTCSPGPRYYVLPSITRNGKSVAPAQHICGLPKIKTEITPGPSDYATDKANKHLYKCAPAQSMAFRHKAVRTDQPPGPGTYTLPRLVGPNTAYTHASPCYSMTGKRKHNGFAEDLAKTPGPAAFPKVELDIYKKRAPMYTMGTKSSLGGDKTVKPGPADYCPGKVTLIKPQAPAPTFGLRHSLYTAPLISLI